MSEAVIRLAAHEADHLVVLGTDDKSTAPRCSERGDKVRACVECGHVKHLSLFATDAHARDGRRRTCASCRTDYDRRHDYARRARRYGHTPFIELFTSEDLVQRYGQHCFHCRTGPFETIDHLVCVRVGGAHTIANTVPCCRSCNSRKYWREDKRQIAEYLQQRGGAGMTVKGQRTGAYAFGVQAVGCLRPPTAESGRRTPWRL